MSRAEVSVAPFETVPEIVGCKAEVTGALEITRVASEPLVPTRILNAPETPFAVRLNLSVTFAPFVRPVPSKDPAWTNSHL